MDLNKVVPPVILTVTQRRVIYIPPDPVFKDTQANLIRNILVDKLGTRENHLRMTTGSNISNEYATLSLQSMCFPTLFPYGVGDITRVGRRYDVTLTESNRHLLNQVVADNIDGNSYVYLSAMYNRWMHWSHNATERRRIQGRKNIYMSRNHETSSISESDLRLMIDNNDP